MPNVTQANDINYPFRKEMSIILIFVMGKPTLTKIGGSKSSLVFFTIVRYIFLNGLKPKKCANFGPKKTLHIKSYMKSTSGMSNISTSNKKKVPKTEKV